MGNSGRRFHIRIPGSLWVSAMNKNEAYQNLLVED